jgi:hypothetical protein
MGTHRIGQESAKSIAAIGRAELKNFNAVDGVQDSLRDPDGVYPPGDGDEDLPVFGGSMSLEGWSTCIVIKTIALSRST